jgi:hypothetical protein
MEVCAHGPHGRRNIRHHHDLAAAPPGGYEMMERIAEASPRLKARISGVFYLKAIAYRNHGFERQLTEDGREQ